MPTDLAQLLVFLVDSKENKGILPDKGFPLCAVNVLFSLVNKEVNLTYDRAE